ncbi:M28 family metallopeptidase [Vibrio caribbeanicus]|uniref:M28 family metallopeptidase n=1 Tax=Vibrio caribbeanicus TaxID=701175 RepID=UPI0022853994|nr:M28 family metallopeptidase [Vibrio caribbeanicus]MCY9845563.1 M28 family peptidase [Vibrio caribbeanicus]
MQVSITTNKRLLTILITSTFISGCHWDTPEEAANYVSENISRNDVVRHLSELESRASKTALGNSSTRAAGTDGYHHSVDYVKQVMQDHGYNVSVQTLDFRAWQELPGTKLSVNNIDLTNSRNTPDNLTVDFTTMSYSGNSLGFIDSAATFITPDFQFDSPNYDDTDGCEPEDFNNINLQGRVAIIQRGGCSFNTKALNAELAGAKAVIIFNQGNSEGRKNAVNGTLGSDTEVSIPAFGARYELGAQWFELAKNIQVPVSFFINTKDELVETENVIAETVRGNEENIVMLGAHLDSVPEGPGINDNGSGTAGLLEYAVTMAKLEAPVVNKLRFAWWAAEEAGLVGSQYYTNQLFAPLRSQAEREILDELGLDDPSQLTKEQLDLVEKRYYELNRVKMYLNFDMIGSPNYIFGVMDGDLSDTKDSPDNAYTGDFVPPFGTSHIESIFNQFFNQHSISTVPQALSKRSDYAGFADWGIAFGGLFTGAEKTKSQQEAEEFGGEADTAYDHCYHQACDDFNNVSQTALYTNTQSLAYVTTFYAFSEPLFPAQQPDKDNKIKLSSQLIPERARLRVGTRLKATSSLSDHGHFHGDLDQDID